MPRGKRAVFACRREEDVLWFGSTTRTLAILAIRRQLTTGKRPNGASAPVSRKSDLPRAPLARLRLVLFQALGRASSGTISEARPFLPVRRASSSPHHRIGTGTIQYANVD